MVGRLAALSGPAKVAMAFYRAARSTGLKRSLARKATQRVYLLPQGKVRLIRKTFRGTPGYGIVGTDRYGRNVRIFSERRTEAARIKRQVRRGQDPVFDFQRRKR